MEPIVPLILELLEGKNKNDRHKGRKLQMVMNALDLCVRVHYLRAICLGSGSHLLQYVDSFVVCNFPQKLNDDSFIR